MAMDRVHPWVGLGRVVLDAKFLDSAALGWVEIKKFDYFLVIQVLSY